MFSHFLRRPWGLLYITVLLAIPFLTVVTAVTAQPNISPPGINDRALLPHLPSKEDNIGGGNAIQTPESISWGLGVFQSFRDNNWEIYSSDFTISNPIRLTSHPASDIHPRLNRGATRIVFSSNRDGDYEIFVMNADGSGIQQLTHNDASDINPAWSPNGKQIAFQTYRDGQAEIYIMNADGSEQQRMTIHGNFDGEPTWSPDGNKIAFTSTRTGTPFIYVMNNDGTGVMQLSNQPASFASWSPDGGQIAYSADLDGDSFLELWVMNADGTNQRMLHDPYGQIDDWAKGWSPDGQSISFTEISFVFYQGAWYWQSAYIYAYDTVSDNNYDPTVLLDNNNRNWHPDWITSDIAPPQTEIGPISTYSQAPGFQVSWSGVDQDNGAGLATYDVQYRLNSTDPWMNWQMGVTTTSAAYAAAVADTVAFRVRGRDHAFNYETWPSFNNPSTTFYTWALHGKLTDNRGTPVSDAPLAVFPIPINAAQTNQDGLFALWLKTNSIHTLDAVRLGYGDLAQTSLNWENLAHVYLPPADNALLNGGFEEASAFAAWTPAGSVTAVTQPHHTGTKAALLDSPACPFPCLSEGETPPNFLVTTQAAMVVDSQGYTHIISSFLPDYTLALISRSPSGNWTEPVPMPIQGGAYPLMAVEQNDTLHALWSNNYNVYYVHKSPDSPSWSTPSLLFSPNDPHNWTQAYAKSMAIDSQGGVHVLIELAPTSIIPLSPHHAYYLYRQPDGAWLQPVLLNASDPDFGEAYLGGLMAIGPEDRLHFVWAESSPALYPILRTNSIYHQARLADGQWSNRQTIQTDNEDEPWLEDIAVSLHGTVHIMWSRLTPTPSYLRENYHQKRSPSGNWSSPTLMLQRRTGSDYTPGKIAVDSNEGVHMIMQAATLPTATLYYAFSQDGSVWQSELYPTTGSSMYDLDLTIDQQDIMHILAKGYYRPINATTTRTASISQQVFIPLDMAAPTLAFMAKRPGDVPGDNSGLVLLVNDGASETAVPLANGRAEWNHYWVDMSPWAGLTVQVKFQLTQTVGDPHVQAIIDDVSLGSAYPDIWVHGNGPGGGLPGQTVVFEIAYGNRGKVPAEGTILELDWPESLLLASANITPTVGVGSLTWSLGDLAAEAAPGALVVTATIGADTPFWETISLPISLSSATTELEQQNNEAILSMSIAHRTFFPALLRP